MTKAIFEDTRLTDRSLKQLKYATSHDYRDMVKKIDALRVKRLKAIQLLTNPLQQTFILDKIRNS